MDSPRLGKPFSLALPYYKARLILTSESILCLFGVLDTPVNSQKTVFLRCHHDSQVHVASRDSTVTHSSLAKLVPAPSFLFLHSWQLVSRRCPDLLRHMHSCLGYKRGATLVHLWKMALRVPFYDRHPS